MKMFKKMVLILAFIVLIIITCNVANAYITDAYDYGGNGTVVSSTNSYSNYQLYHIESGDATNGGLYGMYIRANDLIQHPIWLKVANVAYASNISASSGYLTDIHMIDASSGYDYGTCNIQWYPNQSGGADIFIVFNSFTYTGSGNKYIVFKVYRNPSTMDFMCNCSEYFSGTWFGNAAFKRQATGGGFANEFFNPTTMISDGEIALLEYAYSGNPVIGYGAYEITDSSSTMRYYTNYQSTFRNNYKYRYNLQGSDLITTVYITKNDSTIGTQQSKIRIYYPTNTLLYGESSYNSNNFTYTVLSNGVDKDFILSIQEAVSPNTVFNDTLNLSYFQVNKGYVFYGSVRDNENGAVLANANISLYNPSGTLINYTLSDNAGNYYMLLPTTSYSTLGTYTLRCIESGYYTKNMTYNYQNDMVNYNININFDLDKLSSYAGTATIEIRVYDIDGITPLNNVNITAYNSTNLILYPLDLSLSYIKYGYTANYGLVRFDNVSAGQYTFTGQYGSYPNCYTPSINCPADTVTHLTMTFVKQQIPYGSITPTPAPNNGSGSGGSGSGSGGSGSGSGGSGSGSGGSGSGANVDIASSLSTSIYNMLISWGVPAAMINPIIGLGLIFIFDSMIIIAGEVGESGKYSAYVLPGVIVMTIVIFIIDCLVGFFPIWILLIAAILVAIGIVWSKVGGGSHDT